jgi:hypothetical protein
LNGGEDAEVAAAWAPVGIDAAFEIGDGERLGGFDNGGHLLLLGNLPQGLKPQISQSHYGTAKAVPFQNAGAKARFFFAACSARVNSCPDTKATNL